MGKTYAPVRWKKGNENGKPHTYKNIGSVGWINVPINLGKLQSVRETENTVIFEFFQKGRFDAWSSLNSYGFANRRKLKPGHSYVVEGTILAKCKSKKFEGSSTSKGKYSLCISTIRGIETIPDEKPVGNTKKVVKRLTCLKDLSRKIEAEGYFTEELKSIFLSKGEIYRYVACPMCFTALSRRDVCDNIYYCRKCEKQYSSRERKICAIIRNVEVVDESGSLSGLVIYHDEIEKLFGRQKMEQICNEFTDQLSIVEFQQVLLNSKLNAVITHQRQRGASFNPFFKKIKMERIAIVSPPVTQDAEDSITFPNEVGIGNFPTNHDQQHNGNILSPTAIAISNLPNSNSAENEENNQASNNQDGIYAMKMLASGYNGLGLVINIDCNIDQRRREGSELDVKALLEVFPKLGIKVFGNDAVINPDRMMLDSVMDKFKKELVAGRYSCSFFVVMGHGQQNTVRIGDGTKLNIFNDIMCLFSEDALPEFAENPKIFIFGACQDVFGIHEKELVREGFKVSSKSAMNHMLWVTPCLPGQRSKRNPGKGSYFIQTLCRCLWDHKKLELKEILNKVSAILGAERRHDKGVYSPTVSFRLFLKFYFKTEN